MSASAAAGGLQGTNQFTQSLVQLLLAAKQNERQREQDKLQFMLRQRELDLREQQSDRQFKFQESQLEFQRQVLGLKEAARVKKVVKDIEIPGKAPGGVRTGQLSSTGKQIVGKLPGNVELLAIRNQADRGDLEGAIGELNKTRDQIESFQSLINSPDFESFAASVSPDFKSKDLDEVRREALDQIAAVKARVAILADPIEAKFSIAASQARIQAGLPKQPSVSRAGREDIPPELLFLK